jgi:hypothetical protein
MFHQMNLTVANDARLYHDAPALDVRFGQRARAHDALRKRSRGADLVLRGLCSAASFLAIEEVGDRSLLYEQYDFKLWSYRDRLGVFCLSTVPSLMGMALVLGLYKVLSALKSTM